MADAWLVLLTFIVGAIFGAGMTLNALSRYIKKELRSVRARWHECIDILQQAERLLEDDTALPATERSDG